MSGILSLDPIPAPDALPRRFLVAASTGPSPLGRDVAHAPSQDGRATLHGLGFTPDGAVLISLVSDSSGGPSAPQLAAWDARSEGQLGLVPVRAPPEASVSLAVSPDGRTVAIGDDLGQARLWPVSELRAPVERRAGSGARC